MARIRSVKPEFWEDDVIGALSRDARLLFIAAWNMADDEGLLRWTAVYVKANAFMYDDDLGLEDVTRLMQELVDAGLVLPYRAGKARQALGWVVTFARHQKPNRPQPSKFPPPSLQSAEVLQAYIRRDSNACHLCGYECLTESKKPRLAPSLDHVQPRSKGGSDYPSNVKLSHVSCNKARRDRPVEECSGSDPLLRSLRYTVSESVSESVPHSPPEGSGGESSGEEQESSALAPPSAVPIRRDVEQICVQLATRMVENGCKPPAITDRWRESARLLLDRDKRPITEVQALIDWCQNDEFWRGNIESLPKFRRQYDRLRLQRDRGRAPKVITNAAGHEIDVSMQ